MKPSRARNQVSIVAYAIISVAAVVLLILADNGELRIGMTLVLITAGLGIALAVYQLRRPQ